MCCFDDMIVNRQLMTRIIYFLLRCVSRFILLKNMHEKKSADTTKIPGLKGLMTIPIKLRTHLRPRTKHDSTVVTEETDWGGKKKKMLFAATCYNLCGALDYSHKLLP